MLMVALIDLGLLCSVYLPSVHYNHSMIVRGTRAHFTGITITPEHVQYLADDLLQVGFYQCRSDDWLAICEALARLPALNRLDIVECFADDSITEPISRMQQL